MIWPMMTEILLSADGLITTLESIDKQLLLDINGSDSLYLDRVVRTLTHGATWIPLYLSLFYIVLKNNDSFRHVFYVLGAVGLGYILAGAVDDGIVKPLVARWRPTHDPEIGLLVDIVDGYRGGRYGFFSAHASNTFCVAVLFCWIVRSRLLSIVLVAWSLLNCWTRMYLGVHFPGDILVGLLWGGTVATCVYYLYYRMTRDMTSGRRLIYTHYTATGYLRTDGDIPVCVIVLTVAFALIKACFV